MKTATFTKILAITVLVAAPMALQARESANVGKAEKQAGIGSLLAIFAAAAAVAGGVVALSGGETPTSA